jgi:RNA polymerase sigma factor (sigma-70 family)
LPIDLNNPVLFKKISDTTLIEGIRSQDDKILNWLYDNYLHSVRKHVLSNGGLAEDVSDVFQDTIITLYNQITRDELSLTTDLKGYFFSIARNIWSAQLRKKQRNVELVVDHHDIEENEEQNGLILERIISRVFKKLKPDEQEVLNLFAAGKSYEEIAAEMDLKNEIYARRKKYLSKEALLALLKEDPEYQENFLLMK